MSKPPFHAADTEIGQAQPAKMGAFLGVFTPTILTILGVIMFLRTGWVVGNVGLTGTFLVVIIANSITLITCLSMSALATNMRVGVGGAYYLISRSVGLEAGGAIGIPLYLSQTLSVTLYAYGLAESLRVFFPDIGGVLLRVLAVLIVIGVSMVASRSASFTLKAQIPIMVLIFLALGCLFLGVDWGNPKADVGWSNPDVGLWQVFAVFFPAVTGLLAGVSLSGDLKDPGKAIPAGALAAVVLGFAIYLIIPLALYYGAPADVLQSDELVWTQLAVGGFWFIVPGMWGAILSSAFGSILGAPRTLQALAKDGLAPEAFAKNDPKTGEPVVGLAVSGLLAVIAAVVLPGLNMVAEWVTVFFLTTYGALNLVACLEGMVGDPSFRPRIRVHWVWSGIGAISCLLTMFLVNEVACVVAVLLEGIIFWVISRRTLKATWGDARSGILLTGARFAILRLRYARVEPRNWRPHILVFAEDLEKELPMARLATQFGQHRGIVTVISLLFGDLENHGDLKQRALKNQRLLDKRMLAGFCEVIAVPDLHSGVLAVSQANGFAGLDSNTVLLGWPTQEEDSLPRMLGVVRRLDALAKCSLIYRHKEIKNAAKRRKIVVWWKGREHNGDLMLLLAHLLKGNKGWADSEIVLKSVASDQESAARRHLEFEQLLPEIRIDAGVHVVVHEGSENVGDVIARHSQDASLVFMGMAAPASGEEVAMARRMQALAEDLPSTVFVRNSGPFRGRLV